MTGSNRFPHAQRWLALPLTLLVTACATTVAPPATAPAAPATSRAPVSAPAAQSTSPAAAQERDDLRALTALQERLYRVSAPLLVNNTELCRGNARNLLGFTAKNKYSYSPDLVSAAQKSLGLDDRLQVAGVLAGSGAARAGVRQGDLLVAIEDKPMPQGENAERQAGNLLAPLVTGRSSVKMTVLRDGSNLTMMVPLTYACAFGVELGNIDNVVAYSDGRRILVTRGMRKVAASDNELAAVLAKEMAHSALSHASRLRISAAAGGVIDKLLRANPDMSSLSGLAGIKPMPQELDAMADKLSLYLLARAGYSVDEAIRFWERIANQYPATVPTSYTALHPATQYRIEAMQKTVADIKRKQAMRKPLLP